MNEQETLQKLEQAKADYERACDSPDTTMLAAKDQFVRDVERILGCQPQHR